MIGGIFIYVLILRVKLIFFYDLIFFLVDKYAPLVLCKLKENDKPWVTVYLKKMIHNRDVAFRKGDIVLFNLLRNKVNRLRKSLRKSFVEKNHCGN